MVEVINREKMSSTAPVKVAKKTTSSKTKKVASHPKYSEMIQDALTNLKVCLVTYLLKNQ